MENYYSDEKIILINDTVSSDNDTKLWLSIVIPMYNTEKYIENCIKSLLNQNIPENEFEIIVINDGSLDGGPEIVQNMMSEHKNIKLISTENGGLSRARNTGIANSKGEYIFFVDSDDYIAYYSIMKCMQCIKTTKLLDILFFEYKTTFRDNDFTSENIVTGIDETIRTGIEYFGKVNVNNSACYYFIRKQFTIENDLRFIEGRFCEDGMFLIDILTAAERVMHCDADVYRYFQKNSASLTKAKSEKHLLKFIDDFLFAVKHLNRHYLNSVENGLPESFVSRLEMRRNSYILFMQIRMIRAAVEPKKAQAILKDLEEIGCYPYKKVYNGIYGILHIILTKKLLFVALCYFKNTSKRLMNKNK